MAVALSDKRMPCLQPSRGALGDRQALHPRVYNVGVRPFVFNTKASMYINRMLAFRCECLVTCVQDER